MPPTSSSHAASPPPSGYTIDLSIINILYTLRKLGAISAETYNVAWRLLLLNPTEPK